MENKTCDWALGNDLELEYHNNEWGRPVYDDKKLFETLVLEMMQAGLSWSTILAKRETMRQAFDGFDYNIIALYNEDKIAQLLNDPGVIRHKLKLNALVNNAKFFIEIANENNGFSNYIWSFVDNKPIIGNWKSIDEVPAKTELSDKISKDLKKRGFKFLGSTTVYAYLQAIGVVNDHLVYCDKFNVK